MLAPHIQTIRVAAAPHSGPVIDDILGPAEDDIHIVLAVAIPGAHVECGVPDLVIVEHKLSPQGLERKPPLPSSATLATSTSASPLPPAWRGGLRTLCRQFFLGLWFLCYFGLLQPSQFAYPIHVQWPQDAALMEEVV